MSFISVSASTVSEGWLQAIGAVYDEPGRAAFHTVVHIEDPLEEVADIRGAVDNLLQEASLPPVVTVANTIFPSGMAQRSADHTELAKRYRSNYERICKFPGNHRGTYFGRLVAYPASTGQPVDQVANIIRALVEESKQRGPKTARYEAVVATPDPKQEEATSSAVPIYAAGTDNSVMGFPCLSHCSFQLDREGRLHLLAQYRSQYMVRRAYGNYIGLGQLLNWIATQASVEVGQLTVVSGYARVDQSVLMVGRLLAGARR